MTAFTEQGGEPEGETAVTAIFAGEALRLLRRIREVLGPLRGRHIAILGAEHGASLGQRSPSSGLGVAVLLTREGASVAMYDSLLPASTILAAVPAAVVAGALLDAARGADAILIAADSLEFRNMDLAGVRRVVALPLLIDVVGAIDPRRASLSGFTYVLGMRPVSQPATDEADRRSPPTRAIRR